MEVEFAPEHRIALEKSLAKLPPVVFTASDALGWVYQIWRSKKEDEVTARRSRSAPMNCQP